MKRHTRESVVNQYDRVIFDPSNFDQPDPRGEDNSRQANRIYNRHRVWKIGDGCFIYDDSIPEFLIGITEHFLSIDASDERGEGNFDLKVGKTERFDGDLDLVGSGERGVGGSHGSVAVGVL